MTDGLNTFLHSIFVFNQASKAKISSRTIKHIHLIEGYDTQTYSLTYIQI